MPMPLKPLGMPLLPSMILLKPLPMQPGTELLPTLARVARYSASRFYKQQAGQCRRVAVAR